MSVNKAKRHGRSALRLKQRAKQPRSLVSLERREDAQVGISTASYNAVSDRGHPVPAGIGVFPIVLKSEDESELSVIATGFFVGPDIVMTARHVFDGQDPQRIACLQILGDNKTYVFRRFRHIENHPLTDISVCHLWPLRNSTFGADLLNYVLPLGGAVPRPGTLVTTYAYPDTVVRFVNGTLHLTIAAHHYDGEILDVFPQRRDNVMLPFPCIRTSVHLHGGASGGPVINPATGVVVGINTSSFSGATNESYAALTHPALDMKIPHLDHAGGVPLYTTLRQLSMRGYAIVVPENVLTRRGVLRKP